MPKEKRPTLDERLAQYDPSRPLSQEEQAWLDVVPVGREFGSADAVERDDDANAHSE